MTKPEDWFDQLKKAYPKRSKGKAYAWPGAFKQIQKRFKEGRTFEEVLQGTKDYCEATKLSGDYGTEFVKQASTFFGPDLHFLDEFETEDVVPEVRYRRPEKDTETPEEKNRKCNENLARLRKMHLVKGMK